jgi:hypothetical protein
MPGMKRELPDDLAGAARQDQSRRRAVPIGVLRTAAMLCILTALGLALGACTKCDVPIWSAPRACHDAPAQQ